MINNYSLLHIEANQCKAVLEQVLTSKPVFSTKNKNLCDIVQTVLYGMCDKIKNESLTATEKISAGILKVLLSNITSAYENMFEANELFCCIRRDIRGNIPKTTPSLKKKLVSLSRGL